MDEKIEVSLHGEPQQGHTFRDAKQRDEFYRDQPHRELKSVAQLQKENATYRKGRRIAWTLLTIWIVGILWAVGKGCTFWGNC